MGDSSISVVPRLTSSSSSGLCQNLSSKNEIYRTVIDQSTNVIGCLYNAITDSMHDQLLLNIKLQSKPLRESICDVERGDTLENNSILKMIRMNEEQRLSLMLNMVPNTEVSSLFISPIPIDKNTRFIYYRYAHENKYIPNDPDKVKRNISPDVPLLNSTHIITGSETGIQLLIVLQISPTSEVSLDDLLKRTTEQLAKGRFVFTDNEKNSLNQITVSKVFSNIVELIQITKLAELCDKLTKIQKSETNYRPIEITLRSINWLNHPSYSTENNQYFAVEKPYVDQIEQHLLELSHPTKNLIMQINDRIKTLLEQYFNQRFQEIHDKTKEVTKLYSNHIKSIAHLVREIRCGREQQKRIDDILTNEQTKILKNDIKSHNNYINNLINKTQLIIFLNVKNINYINVEQLIINKENNIDTILKQIIKTNEECIIFCTSDELKGQDLTKWTDNCDKLIEQRQNNAQLNCIYADFSYCSFRLTEMELIPFDGIEKPCREALKTIITPVDCETVPSSNIPPTLETEAPSSMEVDLPGEQPCPTESNPSSVNYINVLLLGESGVGKSTFINAFINYLAYENLDQAHTNKPIVIIPVSFLMTTGDNFDEHMIQFGNEDLNENHNRLGQSVTQKCKSYIFNINNQTKLRLIDTPGIGDTRGTDQDDQNLNHILSYINNLEQLNGICILLKPNQSRLNVIFRSYFDYLFKFLGSDVRDNIIFCFTNTRSTFYTPGGTAPLLKSLIEKHQIQKIPFKKFNTFCFDSESFRYLIAEQHGISFDEYQQQEFKQSWIKSVPESKRMFEYICNRLKPYSQNQWKSIDHAQYKIIQLIRPMLETITNIYRNLILIDEHSTYSMISIRPKICPRFSTICYKCTRFPKVVGEFMIIPDDPHVFQDKCGTCSHSFQEHITIDYTLDYDTHNNGHNQSSSEMNKSLNQIKNAIQEFAQFFSYIFYDSNQIDPMLSALDRMTKQEDYIRQQTTSNDHNSILYDKLLDLKKEYDETWRKPLVDSKDLDLNRIYNLINDVSQIELVNEKLNIVKQVHQKYFEEDQKHIPHTLVLD